MNIIPLRKTKKLIVLAMKIESYHSDPGVGVGGNWIASIRKLDGSRASESRKGKRL